MVPQGDGNWRSQRPHHCDRERAYGSVITQEHTLQTYKEEMKINKKKKMDLTLKILIQGEEDDLKEEMTHL